MRGLYILDSSHLKLNNTLKIGMSEKLENRWANYKCFIPDAHYLYCYEFLDDLTKKDILYLESLVLNETKHLRNMSLATEYRIIDCDTLHKIIISYLDQYDVKYKIHEKPIFNKPSGNNILEFEEYDFEEIFKNPPTTFKDIKPKNNTNKITNILKTEGFINIEFINTKCIIANKNNDLYIIKKRDAKKLQEKPYNAFTRDNKISNHYNEISSLLPNKKYNDINYCYLIVNNDNYFLAELKNINKKYSIDNIKNGTCDDEIIIVKHNDMKHLIY